MWQTTTTMMTTKDWDTESDVEPAPRRQKKAIDELRAHLERRQEGRPTTTSSGTAYASLSKHLEAIEAAANRYESVHGTTFGQLQEVKATRSKTSFRSITETDVQGRGWSDDFRYEKETPEVADQQKQRCFSGLTIEGLQQKQNDQRLKETKFCLQDVTRGNREPIGDGCAVTMETDNSTSWKCQPSSGVATDNSMRFAQTIDFQPQDRIPSDLHPSRLQNFSASNHASWTSPFTRAAVEPEPDSPSSHSLPDLYRRSSFAVSTQSLTLRRPASTDTGFPSSEYRLTKNHSAAVVMDMGGNGGGGCTLKPCSPDQSTNYMNYSADNLPSIIASARLDDDCEFTSSFAEPRKETIIAKDNHNPVDRSQNASFRSRRNAINSGTVGTGFNSGTAGIGFNSGTVGTGFNSGTVGIGFSSGTAGTGFNSGTVGTGFNSSPEPPSSTFEDDTMADKSKYEDNNTKATDSAIPCKICQDVANGFHYGVWSCEGCKAFFKRSITGSAKYVCPADNNCTINRLRKKSCQACRLRKCYEYGMSPGNCRGENGSKTRKRRLQEADRKEDSKNGVNGDDIRMHGVPSNQRLSGSFQNVPHSFQSHPTATVPASGPAGILQHLLAVERPIRFADFVDVRTVMDAGDAERIQLVASITKLVNLQLTDVVTWSRNLPGFSALNLNIRTHLLVSSWSEILLLTNAFYSLQCTNAIAIAPNLHLTKERCEVIGMVALYNRLMAIVKSFQQLALTHNEMLLMQVLLLVNADLTAPQLIPLLDGLRSSLMQSWHQSSASSGQGQGQGQGHVDHDRISRLLMLLPHIRHCSLLFQRFLSDFRRDSRIPFNGFLQEVTDGRHQFDEVSVLELLVEAEEEGAGLHASVH